MRGTKGILEGQCHQIYAMFNAGNRRKEQNIVKKSVGFNWGPSAVSTTYWTGFRLSDILKHCGAKTPLEGARHIHFKGVEKELPQVC